MSFLVETPADAARRRGLRQMRIVATALLVLAGVVWVATIRLDQSGAWGYVNFAAKAAMVGALADWFAVAALFKHPLGLPIPHTALVKRRKAELGRSLEEFVTDNFMTEAIARDRLLAADVPKRLGVWLSDPAHRERALTEVVRVGKVGLARIKDEDVSALLDDFLLPRLAREPISPIAGSLLEGIVDDGVHNGLVDLTLEHLQEWLRENPGAFKAVVGERAPWWSPPWVDGKVISWSYNQVITWLEDIRTTPGHPARVAFDDLLRQLSHDLQHDPEVMERAETLKARLLANPQVSVSLVSLWGSFKTTLLTAMDDRASYFWVRGDELLTHLSGRLISDDEVRTRIDGYLGDLVGFFVNTYGGELAQVISYTVDSWDAEVASQRIELFVGRDLQFIRINGTIIGALAGVVIHAISKLVGH
ncbi:MAG: DUF445 domain-containing protein [Dermatophilaceae bacterium]|nr:DUF445 domain-containing protein [Intrasporangiaceae bacterium]